MRALIHKGYIENTIDSLATKSSQMEDILIPKYKDLWAEFAWDSDSALCPFITYCCFWHHYLFMSSASKC
ncbi:unnamed protein product [Rhizophagus irregularis]|nr:unnamed protein product [Rhizophagus irregularis]